MHAKAESEIQDLYHVPEHGKAELVGGEIIRMSPTGGLPSYAAGEIFASLRAYAKQTRSGHAVGDNTGFVVDLPHRKSFAPDVAYYRGPLTMKFLEGSPVFAVEVRSEGDYGPAAERAIRLKRLDYFAAGTLVVWDVDLLSEEVVRVYSPDQVDQPKTYRRGDMAVAEPALPGWSMPVNDLFP